MKKNMTEDSPIKQIEEEILSNYDNVGSSNDQLNYCIDGRQGDNPDLYVQSLGGSLNIAVVDWILNNSNGEFKSSIDETFSNLQTKGYRVGFHTSDHYNEGESGCGFADLEVIIDVLYRKSNPIFDILFEIDSSLNKKEWDEIIKNVKNAKRKLPKGDEIIFGSHNDHGADLQKLYGEHNEKVAIINLEENTTLNVNQNQRTPAFNLDLWWVKKQAGSLGIDQNKTSLLTLGLYVATEMVLVENKGKQRLPIIVRK